MVTQLNDRVAGAGLLFFFFLLAARGEHAIGRGATTPFLPFAPARYRDFSRKNPAPDAQAILTTCLYYCRLVSWDEYLREQALYILAARPNWLLPRPLWDRYTQNWTSEDLFLTGVWMGLNAELSTGVNSCKIWNLSEIFGHKRIPVYGQKICK